MLLIRNATVYCPEFLGKKDILTGGNIILGISDRISVPQDVDVEVIDANGMTIVPGLIDNHVHIAGAQVQHRRCHDNQLPSASHDVSDDGVRFRWAIPDIESI